MLVNNLAFRQICKVSKQKPAVTAGFLLTYPPYILTLFVKLTYRCCNTYPIFFIFTIGMSEKSLYTMKDITGLLGVHRNTVMNRLKDYDFLLDKKQRKRYYNIDELALIKKLFNAK